MSRQTRSTNNDNTSASSPSRASITPLRSNPPRSILTVTSPSAGSSLTLTREGENEGTSCQESSAGQVTTEEEDWNITSMRYMNEEENGGDGGESDVDGDEFDIHHDSLVIDSEELDNKYF